LGKTYYHGDRNVSDTVSLYGRKLAKMSDYDLLKECETHGKTMERGSMTRSEKIRAKEAFKVASERESLSNERELLLTALRVLRLF
jgi:hypothetical protein